MHRKDKDGLTKSNLILKVTTKNKTKQKTKQKKKNNFKIFYQIKIKHYQTNKKRLILVNKKKKQKALIDWHYNYVLLVQHRSHFFEIWLNQNWVLVHISFVRSFVRLFDCSLIMFAWILMFVRTFCKFTKTAFLYTYN